MKALSNDHDAPGKPANHGSRKQKEPYMAAFFNFFLPGTGYLYAGSRRRFGAWVLAGYGMAMAAAIISVGEIMANPALADTSTAQQPTGAAVLSSLLGFFSVIVIALAFAIDAYRECMRANHLRHKGISSPDLQQ